RHGEPNGDDGGGGGLLLEVRADEREKDLRVAGGRRRSDSADRRRARLQREGELERAACEAGEREPAGQRIDETSQQEEQRLEPVDAVLEREGLDEGRRCRTNAKHGVVLA